MAGGNLARRLAAIAVAGLVYGVVLVDPVVAQPSGDPAKLNAEVLRLYQAGKYAQATEIAKRVVAILESRAGAGTPRCGHGAEQPGRAVPSARPLGRGRHLVPAQPRHPRESDGPGHPDVAQTLNNLAGLYQAQARYQEAETLYRRSIAIIEKALGSGHPSIASPLNNLAELYRALGHYPQAETLYRRSLAIFEKALGPGTPTWRSC